MIFSRGRRAGRHSKDADAGRSGPRHARPEPGDIDDSIDDEYDDEYHDRDDEYDEYDDEDATDGSAPAYGPYDAEQAPSVAAHLDLGSLKIPVIEGVEVRVQASPDGVVEQVVLVHRDSALQLAAFAAPRTAGIWDEVRSELFTSLRTGGATAEEADGDYGRELCARMRTAEGVADLRFVGIDGPRWMVRGVYHGVAAVDRDAARVLTECLRGLVVERGQDARPVREALPLRLPRELAEQGAASEQQGQGIPVEPRDGSTGAGGVQATRVNGVVPGTGGVSGGGRGRGKPSPRPRRAS